MRLRYPGSVIYESSFAREKFRANDDEIEGLIENLHSAGKEALGGLGAGIDELRQGGSQDAGMEFGEEQGDPQAQRSQVIAEGVGDALDQTMEGEATQIVGHASR